MVRTGEQGIWNYITLPRILQIKPTYIKLDFEKQYPRHKTTPSLDFIKLN